MIDVAVYRNAGAVYALSQTSSTPTKTGSYSNDAFLTRYNRNGSVAWTRQIGPDNDASAGVLTTDASGNLYVSYNDKLEKRRADGSLIWSRSQGGNDVYTVTPVDAGVYVASGNSVYIYVSKYTGAGMKLWTRSVTDDSATVFSAEALDTDASGNLYVLASITDDAYLYSNLYKFNSPGRQLFAKTIADGAEDLQLKGLEVYNNALYLTGELYANWDDPEGESNSDAFIAKFSLGGAEQWRRTFGTPTYDGANDLSVDAGGNLYITGHTYGNLGGVQPRGSDAFLSKFSSSGQALWTKQIGSAGDDYGRAVVACSSSELYLAGEAGGALQGGTYRSGQDGFLRRTDGQGNRVWTDQ